MCISWTCLQQAQGDIKKWWFYMYVCFIWQETKYTMSLICTVWPLLKKTPHAFGCNSGELGIGEVQWHGVKSKSESNPNDPSGPSQTQSVRSLFLGNSNWVVHLGQVPEFLSGLLFNGIKLVYTILYYILTRKFIYRLGTNDVNGSTSVGIPGVSKIQSDLRGKICSWIWIQHGFRMLDCIWH